jgi:hypothetical protein
MREVVGSSPTATTILDKCKEPFLIVLFEILGGAKGSRYVRVISLPLTRTSLIISFKNAFFEPIAFLSAVSAFL